MLRKVYFASSITAIYIVTLGSIGALLSSSQLLGVAAWATPAMQPVYKKPVISKPQTISGKPNRIVIADRSIDLKVNDGTYDPQSRTWTLSDTDAQYATSSSLANDEIGTTFIYGHGTDAVFGKIGSNPPPTGTSAQLFTTNGRVFSYQLSSVQNLKPTDTWILHDTDKGIPRLIVQTCTGAFSEWRTMFIFSFKEVS